MKRLLAALPLLLAASIATAQQSVWQRGRDGRFEVAIVDLGPGTTLEFLCSAYQVPNTAIITLHNITLGAQLTDGKNYDMRFVIDGSKFEMAGIAKDGDLMVSPADANLELWVREVTAALIAGKSAQIAVPSKGWHSALPMDGAAEALEGVFDVCL